MKKLFFAILLVNLVSYAGIMHAAGVESSEAIEQDNKDRLQRAKSRLKGIKLDLKKFKAQSGDKSLMTYLARDLQGLTAQLNNLEDADLKSVEFTEQVATTESAIGKFSHKIWQLKKEQKLIPAGV